MKYRLRGTISVAPSAAIIRALLMVLATVLCSGSAVAQEDAPSLVLENEFLKVTRVHSSPNSVAAHDTVLVPIIAEQNSDVMPISYVPIGGKLAWSNIPEILLIELKKHRDVEMRSCQDTATCLRTIKVGNAQVGERRQLFTSGFVTGSFQQLLPGGSLTSSYYSAKGIDHVLIVALTDATFLLDGVEQQLKRGQVAFTGAKEVEVSAGPNQMRWFTLRLNDPKER